MNPLSIETKVTFPDGQQVSFRLALSPELYVKAEIPEIVEDTMRRASRAIVNKLKEEDRV